MPRTDVAKRAVGVQRCGSTPQPENNVVPVGSFSKRCYNKLTPKKAT